MWNKMTGFLCLAALALTLFACAEIKAGPAETPASASLDSYDSSESILTFQTEESFHESSTDATEEPPVSSEETTSNGTITDPSPSDGKVTFGERFGVTREAVVKELKSHEMDNYYLGTPYRPGPYGSPRGDVNFDNRGPNTRYGKPAMNCAGFVLCVMAKSGMDIDSLNATIDQNVPEYFYWGTLSCNIWKLYTEQHPEILTYHFDTQKEMLESGVLRKGDIILIWKSHVRQLKPGEDNHMGFFWGDNPEDDVMWHSSPGKDNRITSIWTPTPGSTYEVIPLDRSGQENYLNEK